MSVRLVRTCNCRTPILPRVTKVSFFFVQPCNNFPVICSDLKRVNTPQISSLNVCCCFSSPYLHAHGLTHLKLNKHLRFYLVSKARNRRNQRGASVMLTTRMEKFLLIGDREKKRWLAIRSWSAVNKRRAPLQCGVPIERCLEFSSIVTDSTLPGLYRRVTTTAGQFWRKSNDKVGGDLADKVSRSVNLCKKLIHWKSQRSVFFDKIFYQSTNSTNFNWYICISLKILWYSMQFVYQLSN